MPIFSHAKTILFTQDMSYLCKHCILSITFVEGSSSTSSPPSCTTSGYPPFQQEFSRPLTTNLRTYPVSTQISAHCMIFHTLNIIQDMHKCMYTCLCMHVLVHVLTVCVNQIIFLLFISVPRLERGYIYFVEVYQKDGTEEDYVLVQVSVLHYIMPKQYTRA